VSEPHEPSYYEIALTNRQVVVAFVILLVCLLSAFFSGVWIGRESTVRAQDQMARNSPPPPETEPKKEGQSLENLEFFDSKENKAGKKPGKGAQDEAPAHSTPKPAPPVPEPEPPAPSPVQAAPVPAPALPVPTPVPTPAPDRKGKGRKGAAAATPAPAVVADNSPIRPVKPSEAEPAVPKGAVVIQVFSSQDRAQADRVRKKLASGGQKAFLSPVDVAGHTMYRVRIGPFTSRADAQKVAEKVRKVYTMDTWVTE
jgi:DedD protein